jgi:hypothetical protein
MLFQGWIDEPCWTVFQLFAMSWGPGNFYPLIIFLCIHIVLASLLHTLYSGQSKQHKHMQYVHVTSGDKY